MKRLIPLLVILLSCTQTTEEKLKDALTKIERTNLERKGESVERLEIDSVEYSLISEKLYYLSLKTERLLKQQPTGDLDTLISQAPEIKNVYSVSYHINARSNQETYNGSVNRYLQASTFRELATMQ